MESTQKEYSNKISPPEKIIDSSRIIKKKRRPRSAAGDRNYLCGCGKAYLSYPALYTHVKNKHDSKFPIGSNARRKIPRALDDDINFLYTPRIKTFFEEFKSTGNSEIVLDRSLAEARVFPAINLLASGTRKEELLYTSDEIKRLTSLRRWLAGGNPKAAMRGLLKLMKMAETNAVLLEKLNPAR